MANSKTTKWAKKGGAKKTAFRKASSSTGILSVLNGVLFASALTVALIMILAVLLKFGILGDSVIPIFNQVVKAVCIALAAFLSVRSPSGHPWFRGIVSGILYIILGALVFSLIVGSFSFSLSNLADIAMGAVVGGIVAFIFGKKSEN